MSMAQDKIWKRFSPPLMPDIDGVFDSQPISPAEVDELWETIPEQR